MNVSSFRCHDGAGWGCSNSSLHLAPISCSIVITLLLFPFCFLANCLIYWNSLYWTELYGMETVAIFLSKETQTPQDSMTPCQLLYCIHKGSSLVFSTNKIKVYSGFLVAEGFGQPLWLSYFQMVGIWNQGFKCMNTCPCLRMKIVHG